MLFNSIPFAVFLPVVLATYWIVGANGPRLQSVLLLAASYVFYGWWDWRFLSLMAFMSAVNFSVGLGIGSTTDTRRRDILLAVAVLANLGTLAVFKYLGFLVESFGALLQALGLRADMPVLALVLPLGISFYALQILTYPLGIHKGLLEPTRRPVEFFAFCCFFPLLVAGPIERASNLLPQFLQPRAFDQAEMRDGLRQILNGLSKGSLSRTIWRPWSRVFSRTRRRMTVPPC